MRQRDIDYSMLAETTYGIWELKRIKKKFQESHVVKKQIDQVLDNEYAFSKKQNIKTI